MMLPEPSRKKGDKMGRMDYSDTYAAVLRVS